MNDDQRERLAEELRSVASDIARSGASDSMTEGWRDRILSVAFELDPTDQPQQHLRYQ